MAKKNAKAKIVSAMDSLARDYPGAADLYLRLGEAANQPDMARARRWFEDVFVPPPFEDWTRDIAPNSEASRYFRMVTGHWQTVAVLWRGGYLPDEIVFTNSREFRRVWERSRDFVAECRAAGYGRAFLHELEEMSQAFDHWLEQREAELKSGE